MTPRRLVCIHRIYRYRDVLEPATARGCHQGLLGSDACFAGILEGIRNERHDKNRHVAVAITKPPETVSACCLSCMSCMNPCLRPPAKNQVSQREANDSIAQRKPSSAAVPVPSVT